MSIYDDYRKQILIKQSLCDADAALRAGQAAKDALPVDSEADKEAALISARNAVIAGTGLKAELLGNISNAPTIKLPDLMAMGFDADEAAVLIADGLAKRAAALALSPIAEK